MYGHRWLSLSWWRDYKLYQAEIEVRWMEGYFIEEEERALAAGDKQRARDMRKAHQLLGVVDNLLMGIYYDEPLTRYWEHDDEQGNA